MVVVETVVLGSCTALGTVAVGSEVDNTLGIGAAVVGTGVGAPGTVTIVDTNFCPAPSHTLWLCPSPFYHL